MARSPGAGRAPLIAAKDPQVPRPTKKSEYRIVFATESARKGWQDLAATIRGPLADTWDFLTRTPTERTPTNYPLKGEERSGTRHVRWQHKPTARGDARIWFYLEG
jgi:hypothetical protein